MGLPLHCISTVVFKSVQIGLGVCVSDLRLEGAIVKRIAFVLLWQNGIVYVPLKYTWKETSFKYAWIFYPEAETEEQFSGFTKVIVNNKKGLNWMINSRYVYSVLQNFNKDEMSWYLKKQMIRKDS